MKRSGKWQKRKEGRNGFNGSNFSIQQTVLPALYLQKRTVSKVFKAQIL